MQDQKKVMQNGKDWQPQAREIADTPSHIQSKNSQQLKQQRLASALRDNLKRRKASQKNDG